MTDVEETLRSSHRILLVDWPDISVPSKLLEAGFEVFGVSPKGYSKAKLIHQLPNNVPTEKEQARGIEFERLERPPDQVDIVHVYRPAEELRQIIESQVDQTGARALWLQPPITSEVAQVLCAQRKLDFVEGFDIVETIQRLLNRK